MIAAILNHLWQSSLFALAVGSLTLLFRNNGASIRHGLWLVASVKFLLPFSLLATLGGAAFTHPVPASSLQALAKIEPAAAPFAVSAVPQFTASGQLSWALALAALWALGSLAIVIFWLARAARLSAIVRAATPIAFDAPIPVRATSELLEPGLAGIFRPVILVPESLTQKLSNSEIETILAHELCHLRRRDNLAAMVHMLVEAAFWFHPLVWFIGARLVEEREQACDEGVLDDGKKPLDYAEAILKVCRLYFRSPLPCASGVSGADLERRITAIMMRRDTREVDPHKLLLLGALGVVTVMMPLVIGGLKPAANAPLVQSLVQAIAPAQSVMTPASVTPDPVQKKTSQARPVSVQKRVVAAPAIDADIPIIIVPLPQVVADEAQQAPVAPSAGTEDIYCRAPQRLQESRLLGPRVCLPKREWDRIAAQNLVLLPDGRTLATGYEKEHSLIARTCRPAAPNTSTALMALNFTCN